jgi:hypothetical protein
MPLPSRGIGGGGNLAIGLVNGPAVPLRSVLAYRLKPTRN